LARQQVIEDVYGNWEQSYNRLSCLLQAMQTYLPRFVYKLKTSPITNGEEFLPTTLSKSVLDIQTMHWWLPILQTNSASGRNLPLRKV